MYLACLSALAQICLFTVCLLGFHSQQQWMVTGAQMACCVYVCVSENRERQTHRNKSSTSARLPEDQHHIDTKMQHSPIWTHVKPHQTNPHSLSGLDTRTRLPKHLTGNKAGFCSSKHTSARMDLTQSSDGTLLCRANMGTKGLFSHLALLSCSTRHLTT